jgi:hypothetical protein
MTTREVRCEACGTLNRLPGYSVRRIPECGKCNFKLPEARSTAILRAIYRFRIQIMVVPMLGLLVWAVWDATISGGAKQTLAEMPRAAAKQPAPTSTCVKYVLPSHGLYEEDDTSERPGLLTIRTAPGPFYLVSLEKVSTGLPALLFFLYGGQPLDASVPLGEFRLKFAAGSNWCGDADLFGDDTVFSEADESLTFERTLTDNGYSTSHRTVELTPQTGGGLITKKISRTEFFGR